MILAIPDLVKSLLPDHFSGVPISVLCVRTTRPKFLVFARQPDQPVCVVQVGPKEEVEKVHSILSRLHLLVPELVAQSLACVPFNKGNYLQIQSGLRGLSWFRLAGLFRSRKDRDNLRDRSVQALDSLHTAVAKVPEWCCRIHPAPALKRQIVLSRLDDLPLSSRAYAYLEKACEALDSLGEVASFCQHGDFCLNNLLVSPDRLAVIDFDEFGETAMPLHDEIGLALSLTMIFSGSATLPGPEDVAVCLQPALQRSAIEQEHLPGLFLHHLLWRANKCRFFPTRAGLRKGLLAMLEEFCLSPQALFSNLKKGLAPDANCFHCSV